MISTFFYWSNEYNETAAASKKWLLVLFDSVLKILRVL